MGKCASFIIDILVICDILEVRVQCVGRKENKMNNDLWDNYECEGQLSLEDYFETALPERMFAVSKIFAAARKQMNLAELKTFVYCLTTINWTDTMPNLIYLDKKTLARIVGIKSDIDHMSVDLERSIMNLPDHSLIEFKDKEAGFHDRGFIINRVTMLKNRVRIKFDDEYIKLFSNLEKDYITMWSSDIFNMSSERSIKFYEDLRLNSDTRTTNRRGYGIKALKEMFEIPKEGKGSYMRENGHFDRANFEKYVIDPLCEDMKKSRMIQLIRQEDGKLFRKVKKGNRVLGYEFEWVVSDRPGIVDAAQMAETQKAIEKNPEILKVAADIVKGQKKPKKNSFNSYEQRHYTAEELSELEMKLLNHSAPKPEPVPEQQPETSPEQKALEKILASLIEEVGPDSATKLLNGLGIVEVKKVDK